MAVAVCGKIPKRTRKCIFISVSSGSEVRPLVGRSMTLIMTDSGFETSSYIDL